MLHSWVAGADGSGFPAEHLPYGVVTPHGRGAAARVACRIGGYALDLPYLVDQGLLEGPFTTGSLNPFMATGPARWREVRHRLTDLVCDPAARARVEPGLWPLDAVTPGLPFEVADYVDFYSSMAHATNLGRLFRPGGEPLLDNWRSLPVGYHGRSGTVVVSGTPVVRPWGQRRDGDEIVFAPSARLDIELEVGMVVGWPSHHGRSVPVGEAPEHVFGLVLVNDWSARDIQAWEYRPLGPFLGKSFATSVAAWITPLDALAEARVEGPAQYPDPLSYLQRDGAWGLSLELTVALEPSGGGTALEISRTSFADMYWQFPQQIAHLTANGACLRTGDLLASGTVSGPERGSEGSLVELTWGGSEPLVVAGRERCFLEDGDQVVLGGSAVLGEGVVLSLGEVRGRIVPAHPADLDSADPGPVD